MGIRPHLVLGNAVVSVAVAVPVTVAPAVPVSVSFHFSRETGPQVPTDVAFKRNSRLREAKADAPLRGWNVQEGCRGVHLAPGKFCGLPASTNAASHNTPPLSLNDDNRTRWGDGKEAFEEAQPRSSKARGPTEADTFQVGLSTPTPYSSPSTCSLEHRPSILPSSLCLPSLVDPQEGP